MVFLDEAGIIARDRFFAVGCLKLAEPSILLRKVQHLRDRMQTYHEIHFTDVTRTSLPFYNGVVDLVAASDGYFSCFVVDRDKGDPVERFGSPWSAYEKLAKQLLLGSIRPRELLVVLADNYSTPQNVAFEQDVRAAVNKKLGRLGVVSVCRLDSKSTDALQIVDLLTSAVAFEFRQAAGIAAKRNAKASLSKYVRRKYGVETCLKGCRQGALNVALYGVNTPKKDDTGRPAGSKSDSR
ncbi:MAG TPA: DUF3800 domain-containing protein [Solirubrobacteraceae bacterium]|nr:DUF3800 domain-containing protein [Solirubrobacteraceae bacterium]